MKQFLPYQGKVSLSGSKSILQRIMLICSIVPARIELSPASRCEDVLEMAEVLKINGVKVLFEDNCLNIDSHGIDLLNNPKQAVCFKGSATAFRFWLARTIICKNKTVIMLSEQLYKRPWQIFIPTLESFGCQISTSEETDAEYPYRIEISPPTQTQTSIVVDGSVSSQFISGLMLVAPLLAEGLKFKFNDKPVSFDYIRLTAQIMQAFGTECHITRESILIPHCYKYFIPESFQIEPDMSSAAFFLTLGVFSEQGIRFKTNCKTRFQPDWLIVDILKEMGVCVNDYGDCVVVKSQSLKGICFDLKDNPDLFPILAVLALFAESKSLFTNVNRLKYKESDRLIGIQNALDLLEADYSYTDDCLEVYPLLRIPDAVTLNTQSDHRLMMAFALLKLNFPQIFLSEGKSVVKSCPEYYSQLASLKQ
jgi:3-phosphoshikimate 1-carboxyvinyltransferase